MRLCRLASQLPIAQRCDATRWPVCRQQQNMVLVWRPCKYQSSKGGRSTFSWTYVNPFALLNHLASSCPSFEALLADTQAADPSSQSNPWSAIIYIDETQPGNLLSVEHNRKIYAIYWTVKQFRHHVICHEAGWIFGGALRSSIVNKVPGGMSCVLKLLMHKWYGSEFNLATSGVTVKLRGRTHVLFVKFSCLLADELAHKTVLLCKGAGGTRLCVYCKHVVSVRSTLSEHAAEPGYLITTNCLDVSRFDLQTDTSIWTSVDLLAAAASRLPNAELDRLQQAIGFTHNQDNMLLDRRLRTFWGPITGTMGDWMHIYLAQGLACDELWFFVHRCRKRHDIRFEQIGAFMATFTWPRTVQSPAKSFSKKREVACESANTFKFSASEILGCYRVLQRFSSMVVLRRGGMDAEHASLTALCVVLDTLQCVSRGLVSPELLHDRIKRHLTTHTSAYNIESARPKLHASLHLPLFLRTHGTLYNCFAT